MIDITAFMPNFGVIMWVGGGGFLLLGAFLWFFVFNQKGQMMCDLFEERMDGSIIILLSNAQVKVIKKEGYLEKWKILGTQIPAFEPKEKSNLIPYLDKRTDKIYLLRDRSGIIHAMNPILDEKTRKLILLPDYRDPMNFVIEEYDERSKIKEENSKWKEFAPYMGMIVAALVVFLAIFFSLQYAEKQRTNIEDAAHNGVVQVQNAASEFSDVLIKARQIVLSQQVIDQTANWTHTIVGG